MAAMVPKVEFKVGQTVRTIMPAPWHGVNDREIIIEKGWVGKITRYNTDIKDKWNTYSIDFGPDHGFDGKVMCMETMMDNFFEVIDVKVEPPVPNALKQWLADTQRHLA